MKTIIACASMLIFLSGCDNAYKTAGNFYLKYVPAGACPDIKILNYGPDTLYFYAPSRKVNTNVNVGSSAPLSLIIGVPKTEDESYIINGGVIVNENLYSYDIGFKCSSTSPELRRTYDVYSSLTLTEDSATPSSLSVSVVASASY